MKYKLDPCPHCESNVIDILDLSGLDEDFWYAKCGRCGATGAYEQSEKEAAENWNSRPIEKRLRAENAELGVERDKLKRRVAELEVLQGFAKKMASNMTDMPPEITKILNSNFMDLIDES